MNWITLERKKNLSSDADWMNEWILDGLYMCKLFLKHGHVTEIEYFSACFRRFVVVDTMTDAE